MSYTAWSVVFGEQPSASKWNILGTNDAGFKDGTNIDAGAITNSHLASGISSAKLSNPYKFHAYRTAALNMPSAAAIVIFDTEDYDTGSNFSTTTGLFTAPVNGYYAFAGAFLVALQNGDHVFGGLWFNGAEKKRFFENTKTGSTNFTDGFYTEIYMAAGDTAAPYYSAGVAGRAALVANNGKYMWFAGHLISAT